MSNIYQYQQRFFPSADRCIHICWSEKDNDVSARVASQARQYARLDLSSFEDFPTLALAHKAGERAYPFLYVDLLHKVAEDVDPFSIEEYLFAHLNSNNCHILGGWLPLNKKNQLLRDIATVNAEKAQFMRSFAGGAIGFAMEFRKGEYLKYVCIARDPIHKSLFAPMPYDYLPIVA